MKREQTSCWSRCRHTAEDNKIAHALKACTENTENPCLADFGGTWVLVISYKPIFTELEGKLAGKKVAIFGSYGWGGSYMQDWEARVKDAGATLVADGVLALGAPDDEAMAKLTEAGKLLAE